MFSFDRKFRDSAIRNELSICNQDALDDDLSPLSGAIPTVVNSNQRGRGADEENGASGEVRKCVLIHNSGLKKIIRSL